MSQPLATAIAQRLASEGWNARVIGDGATAVQAAIQIKPDLIIMDIMLPVMDGFRGDQAYCIVPPSSSSYADSSR